MKKYTATQLHLLPNKDMGGDAVIDGNYRYMLRRWWSTDGKTLAWVLLNPSTANGEEDDATLRRIKFHTKREGYSRLIVVNLFAYRSPYPSVLKQVADPVGEANDVYIQAAFAQADAVVVAWGAWTGLQGRDHDVLSLWTKPVLCLGTTRQGYPRHPCRLANVTSLTLYQP